MSPDVVEAINNLCWVVGAGLAFVGLCLPICANPIIKELKRLADDRESGKEKP